MLSPVAENLIEKYFNLPFPGVTGVRCPYYINRRGARTQLRVLVGKGLPDEIVEESKIISIQYELGLFDKNGRCDERGAELIRKFLVDQNIGIECSGFVSHILRAHYLETKKFDITKKLNICPSGKFIRKLICKLRPIENMNVSIFADNSNSSIINTEQSGYDQVQAGDYIIIMETGPLQKRNHIILIRGVENKIINYVHARAWSSEGKYGHGVTEGKIRIINNNKNLLEQEWIENEKINDQNETYLEAKQAKILELRRLKF
jgi:hypothetical protein